MSFLGKIAESLHLPVSYPAASSEATFRSGPGVDPDEHLWENISHSGPLSARRNLPAATQKQMIDYAYAFYKGNPLAKRAIEIVPQYAIGPGIQYEAPDPQVKAILDAHWTDTTNKWSTMQYERARDLGLVGELCIPTSVNPDNGKVTLGHIDTVLIDEVITDPENPMKVYAISLTPISTQVGDRRNNIRRVYKVIDLSNATEGESRGRLVGLPETDQQKEEWKLSFKKGDIVEKAIFNTRKTLTWWGSCFFLAVNKPLSASRGMSDLLAEYDWLDANDQLLFSSVEKAIESANYIWDVTLEGMNQVQINKWVSEQSKTRPGIMFAHNEKINKEVKTPDLHLEDITNLSTTIKNIVLAGVGLPPVWFGESSTARASAPEMTEPAYKNIGMRQRYIAQLMTSIFRYAIDQAFLTGRLRRDKRQSLDSQVGVQSATFYLKMPEVSSKDQRALAVAITNLSNALEKAVNAKFLNIDQATRIFSRYLETNGLDAWKNEPAASTGGDSTPDNTLTVDNILQKVEESSSSYDFTYEGNRYYVSADPQETPLNKELDRELKSLIPS